MECLHPAIYGDTSVEHRISCKRNHPFKLSTKQSASPLILSLKDIHDISLEVVG